MKPLLLAIDLQKGWRHKTATEEALLNAVELCKYFDGDIIHCRFKNDPESLFHKQLGWKRFVDEYDTAEIEEVVPLKLMSHWRSTYSCIDAEILEAARRARHVFIAGVYTDISVFVTALELFDNGISVSVVKDCVATLHGEPVHQAAIKSLGFSIGSKYLVNSSELPRK